MDQVTTNPDQTYPDCKLAELINILSNHKNLNYNMTKLRYSCANNNSLLDWNMAAAAQQEAPGFTITQ